MFATGHNWHTTSRHRNPKRCGWKEKRFGNGDPPTPPQFQQKCLILKDLWKSQKKDRYRPTSEAPVISSSFWTAPGIFQGILNHHKHPWEVTYLTCSAGESWRKEIQLLTVRMKEMCLDFPHFSAIKQDSQRNTESRILITKLWRNKFPYSSSFCHLDFFPLHSKLFSYILIPPHLGCAFILFFAVFAEFTVKTWDICRTYAGDILEWSHV